MRFRKPTCGAKTRRGTRCLCKPVPGSKRCKFHGGASTGPQTPEGKEVARANLSKASAVINSPLHAETRRARSVKGWETRRKRAKQARVMAAARAMGFSAYLISILERTG
ncbi:HGGxSTG domain-containing protein [Thiocystis violacea]|uniref:HGGxSTG domain-containing protein n=1 Tax=Thiocystis violacea TaxID=13725 RepID=UPI003B83485F|nr:hypothetical protein [Thiocystis violacea]